MSGLRRREACSGRGLTGVLSPPMLLREPQPWCHWSWQLGPGAGGYRPRHWSPPALPPRAPGRRRASIRIGSGYALFPARAGPCRKEEGAEGGGRGRTLPSACPVALAAWGEGWTRWGPGRPWRRAGGLRRLGQVASEPPWGLQAGPGPSPPLSVPSHPGALGPIPEVKLGCPLPSQS